jgi:hypothetical protein
MGRIDLEVAGHAYRPGQPSRAETLAEGSAELVARIRQDTAEAYAASQHAVDLPKRDLGLALEHAPPRRHARL